MQDILLTGPLVWPPLLEAVAGRDLEVEARRGVLTGVAVAGDSCFPPTVPGEGARADGLLIRLEEREVFDRLAFFAAATGAAPVPKHVGAGGEEQLAIAFLASAPGTVPDEEWNRAAWAARWGEVALGAAREIMGYFGTENPEDLHWRMPMILSRAASVEAARAAAPAALRSGMTADGVEQIARREVHAGFFLTREYELRHPVFGGQMSAPLRRELFVATDAALVLPYDPARDRLLLVEQFRMGPYGRGDPRPWVLEPVAGRVDAGETPEEAARRECREEAGLALGGLEHMTSHYCSPGSSTELYHCYLGLADLPGVDQGRGGLASEQEDIRTHILGFERAMALVTSGEVNVGPLVLMLLWLQRERPRLRGAIARS